jgi:cell wall-associated NlpC family hydrolase
MFNKLILCLFGIFLLSACGSAPAISTPLKIRPADAPLLQSLKAHYNDWRGVRYREGGLSRKGVDCSGFVYLAYKARLNRKIPRTTELLAKTGRKIHTSQLRPGDLVFFKTGWKVRHVGIYLQKGRFMHASSSRGVMISRLDNPYWSDAFWMARRL